MNKSKIIEQINSIKPGVNYPCSVHIEEKTPEGTMKLKFLLQSYIVGMYCAIHANGAEIPHQTGDYDNKKFVRGLKKDLLEAVERGAEIEIGPLRLVKTDEKKAVSPVQPVPTRGMSQWKELAPWFHDTFEAQLYDFLDKEMLDAVHVYCLDILEFERYLISKFGYPADEDLSIHEFLEDEFGREAAYNIRKLLTPELECTLKISTELSPNTAAPDGTSV